MFVIVVMSCVPQGREDGGEGLRWNLEDLQEASDDGSSEQSDPWSTEGGYEADSERDDRDDASSSELMVMMIIMMVVMRRRRRKSGRGEGGCKLKRV